MRDARSSHFWPGAGDGTSLPSTTKEAPVVKWVRSSAPGVPASTTTCRFARHEPSFSSRNEKPLASRRVRTQPLTTSPSFGSDDARTCLMSVRMKIQLPLLYQYLLKLPQHAKIFLTTDGHGFTRMKTGSLLSVSIRVHPWLDHVGCGWAALRCIAELHSARRWETPLRGTDPTLLRLQVGDTADCPSPLRFDATAPKP